MRPGRAPVNRRAGARRLSEIFTLFAQAPQALDRASGGLGMGSAIARAIVELHGGDISAYSEGSGMGSTFTVRLPAIEHASAANVSEVQPPPETASCPGKRVLVVDDNPDALNVMADALPLFGYEPVTASSLR